MRRSSPTARHAGSPRACASYLGHAFVGAYGQLRGQPADPRRDDAEDQRPRRRLHRHLSRVRVDARLRWRLHDDRSRSPAASPRDLLDLARPAARNSWGDSLVVGLVTNNEDPDKLARVRVKYPALDGARTRAVGARRRGRRRQGPRADDAAAGRRRGAGRLRGRRPAQALRPRCTLERQGHADAGAPQPRQPERSARRLVRPSQPQADRPGGRSTT